MCRKKQCKLHPVNKKKLNLSIGYSLFHDEKIHCVNIRIGINEFFDGFFVKLIGMDFVIEIFIVSFIQ